MEDRIHGANRMGSVHVLQYRRSVFRNIRYDAAGVRRSAGQQAAILNKLVESVMNADFSKTEKRLKELLGHTPIEVFAGAILGVIIAIIRYV